MKRIATRRPKLLRVKIPGGNYNQMAETIRIIGRAIRAGSRHLPTRNLAAAMATQAAPKDYLGQAQSIYNGFLKRWRYVKDPLTRELVTASPDASFKLVMGGDGVGVGFGKGAGDCDCATVALGSLYESVGFPVRIATIAKPTAPPGKLMDHVYPEVKVPKLGWVTADPVIYPKGGFGDIPPASRKVVYTLEGNVVEYGGNLAGNGLTRSKPMIPQVWERPGMRTYSGLGADDGGDYSAGFFGAEGDGIPLQPWESVGLAGFGYLSNQMGTMGAGNIPVEVGPDQTMFYEGLARTPMIELAPPDYAYMANNRQGYDGMMGLGDDGEPYVYDGLGGFFKRLFKKVKRGFKKIKRGVKKVIKKVRGGIRKVVKKGFSVVRKIGKRIRKGIRSVVKRLPGGKALIKIAGKIRKVAMKVVRPVSKVVGKWAGKLAPIARFIPGYGPAISAGLRVAGRVARTFNRFDAMRRGLRKGRLPRMGFRRGGFFGDVGIYGEDSPESLETQEALAEQMPRYMQ